MRRRALLGAFLGGLGAAGFGPKSLHAQTDARYVRYSDAIPGAVLSFPRDHGSHPDFRTEWWYVTGWLDASASPGPGAPSGASRPLGFQVTFFRSRLDTDPRNPSRFAPRQLLFAHAAVSDPDQARLISEERSARAGFGLANAEEGDLAVHVGDWSFVREPLDGSFQIAVRGREFQFSLSLLASQPVLLEGKAGFSQKGPDPLEASEYYSLPHLLVKGSVGIHGSARDVRGQAWMDREWSSHYLAGSASGWDWIGINLTGGASLMAFRIRAHSGAPLWAGGSLRHADGKLENFDETQIAFHADRQWRSPRSAVTYPIGQTLCAGPYCWKLVPLMDDQELDTSASTGTLYWEGAVRAIPAEGMPTQLGTGEGYLELTGYDRPLKF